MRPTLLLLSVIAIALISGTEGVCTRLPCWTPQRFGWQGVCTRLPCAARGGVCTHLPCWNMEEMEDEEAGGFSVEAGYEKDGKYAKIKWEKDEMDEDWDPPVRRLRNLRRRRLWTAPGIIINDIRNSHTVCTGLCERKSQDNFGNVQCHKDYHCMQRCNRGGSCAPINDELEDFEEEAGGFSVEAGYEKDGKYAKIKWEKDEMDDDDDDGFDMSVCSVKNPCICGFSCHKGRCMDPLGRKCSRKEPCPCGYYCGKRGICTTIGQKLFQPPSNSHLEKEWARFLNPWGPLDQGHARPPSRPNLGPL